MREPWEEEPAGLGCTYGVPRHLTVLMPPNVIRVELAPTFAFAR